MRAGSIQSFQFNLVKPGLLDLIQPTACIPEAFCPRGTPLQSPAASTGNASNIKVTEVRPA